jgi:hypothetical protein
LETRHDHDARCPILDAWVALGPERSDRRVEAVRVKAWPLNDAVKAYEAVAAGDISAKDILKPNGA